MTTAEILRAAAKALESGEDPFAGSFLADNDVTFDQCMTLAEQLAIGARICARAIEDPQGQEAQVWAIAMWRSVH